MMKEKRGLMIAGGEWDQEFASSYIKKQYADMQPELLIAVDRGLEYMEGLGLHPDLLLGDCDSVTAKLWQRRATDSRCEVLQYPSHKDDTDSALAVQAAIERGVTSLCILGATGIRLDHGLANLGLLKRCLEQGVQAELVDTHNRIRMINRSLTMKKSGQFGQYVSILPFSDRVTGITLTGFEYPLMRTDMELGSGLGISNVIVEDTARIDMDSGLLIVIESKDAAT